MILANALCRAWESARPEPTPASIGLLPEPGMRGGHRKLFLYGKVAQR